VTDQQPVPTTSATPARPPKPTPKSRPLWQKVLLAVGGFLLVAVALSVAVGPGPSGPGGRPRPADAPAVSNPDRPGNPAVYARIEAETDCAALQREFDTAEAGPAREWKVPYMEGADARMREVGCYE